MRVFVLLTSQFFYSPYLQLPIGDKRRSGFLIPNGNYSRSSGFDFQLPYYWNIALIMMRLLPRIILVAVV